MRSEGSTTDVANLEEKTECTPRVPASPGAECSGKGWWTMLGWEGTTPNAEEDADGGVDVDAPCVLITITLRSIKSCTAPHRVRQLFVECPMTR